MTIETMIESFCKRNRGNGTMICAEFEKLEEGYRVDAEWQGYGNANMIEAFKMENIDIKKVLDNMKVGETKVYNIGWYPGCGVAKRGIKSEIVEFGK